MSKPEDIPQDLWNAAYAKAVDYLNWVCSRESRLDPDAEYVLAQTIARAIMAARAQEREACAVIADERAAICADAVAKIEAGELYTGISTAHASEGCARLEASHIARLIRREPGATRHVITAHNNKNGSEV